jgi:hypothetical protein
MIFMRISPLSVVYFIISSIPAPRKKKSGASRIYTMRDRVIYALRAGRARPAEKCAAFRINELTGSNNL